MPPPPPPPPGKLTLIQANSHSPNQKHPGSLYQPAPQQATALRLGKVGARDLCPLGALIVGVLLEVLTHVLFCAPHQRPKLAASSGEQPQTW